MINFQFNLASISGIILAVGGAGLYFMRSARPQLSRDYDIFFAAVGLLCGIILVLYGWRFDPIMQFGQVLLTAATMFFAFENFRLRGVATEQARRNTPIVDDERPVSSRYERGYYVAELEELAPAEERSPASRRIRPSRDTRSSRVVDDYDEEIRRPSRRSSTPGDSERVASEDRPRKRRPRPDDDRPSDFDGPGLDGSGEGTRRPSRRNSDGPSRPVSREEGNREDESASSESRPRRRRPGPDASGSRRRSESGSSGSDYADYQPVSYSDDE
ncbi:MAG: Ycf66 family protein [Leptolyngbyaceae cyanobacterium bins.59]|nr:Ycf66 family protein [Leptolyngbyaceae cyanobacterium bins.59]